MSEGDRNLRDVIATAVGTVVKDQLKALIIIVRCLSKQPGFDLQRFQDELGREAAELDEAEYPISKELLEAMSKAEE